VTSRASTNTAPDDITLESALAGVPTAFRTRLIKSYRNLKAAHTGGQHDATGLRTGRFCEVVLRLLQHELTGGYIAFGEKISNFSDECTKLERLPRSAGLESLRVIIPRAIEFLYTLRNKRGIGHEGGDVDANEIDSATCVRVADWCLCELTRIYHSMSLEEAQAILDAITERQLPEVWLVLGKKRLLRTGLEYQPQTLLLLYADPEAAVPVEDLFEWVEHPSLTDFRRRVLEPLHRRRLIEYDRETESVILSPSGILEIEALRSSKQT
jgi:hypothetical protein